MQLKIGELAKRSGLTVRALHHYDSIGLLSPSARTDAGYRLYNRADIARLRGVCFPRGVAVVLFNPRREIGVSVVEELVAQIASFAGIKHDVLVDFVVAAARVAKVADAFVATVLVLEQAHVP